MSTTWSLLLIVAVVVVALSFVRFRGKPREKPAEGRSAYTAALDALIGGRNDEAMLLLKQTVEADSENVDAYLKLGNLLRARGQVSRALQVHRELALRDVRDRRMREAIYESLTEDYIAAQRYDRATEAAERLRELNKGNAYGLEALTRIYEATSRWDKAYECQVELDKLKGLGGDKHLARYKVLMGERLLKADRQKEARKHLKEALKLDPDAGLALVWLGDSYSADGNQQGAVHYWREFSRRFPARAACVFRRLEKAYYEQGKFSEMTDYYEDILARKPHESNTLVALGKMRYKKGELEEAIRTIKEAIDYDSQNMAARAVLALLLAESGDHDRGLEELREIVELLDTAQLQHRCRRCGFRSADIVSRCPSCNLWDPFS